jgi:putative solute:sodium symporter small subunit
MADAKSNLHWARSRALAVAALWLWLACALLAAFAGLFFADVAIAGAPLGFIIAAQASLLGLLALVIVFVRRQARLDRAHGIAED